MKKYISVLLILIFFMTGCNNDKNSYECTYSSENSILSKNNFVIIFSGDKKIDRLAIEENLEYKVDYQVYLDDEFYDLLENDYKEQYSTEGVNYVLTRTKIGATIDINFDLDKFKDKTINIKNSNDKVSIDIEPKELAKLLKKNNYKCK